MFQTTLSVSSVYFSSCFNLFRDRLSSWIRVNNVSIFPALRPSFVETLRCLSNLIIESFSICHTVNNKGAAEPFIVMRYAYAFTACSCEQ